MTIKVAITRDLLSGLEPADVGELTDLEQSMLLRGLINRTGLIGLVGTAEAERLWLEREHAISRLLEAAELVSECEDRAVWKIPEERSTFNLELWKLPRGPVCFVPLVGEGDNRRLELNHAPEEGVCYVGVDLNPDLTEAELIGYAYADDTWRVSEDRGQ